MYKCNVCGFVGELKDFDIDYCYDVEEEDEVMLIYCTNCGNDDQEEIVDID